MYYEHLMFLSKSRLSCKREAPAYVSWRVLHLERRMVVRRLFTIVHRSRIKNRSSGIIRMEQNSGNIKANISMENNVVEAEAEPPRGEPSSEEKGKREKVDCSHRVIEKRRRDRINNSLMQLSELVPMGKFNKKNSGKLEKAEILEVTVHYLTQQHSLKNNEPSTQETNGVNQESKEADKTSQQDKLPLFLRGFKQCISDATRFFQDVEELDVSEGRCYRLIQHLKRQISKYENKECDLTRAGMEDRVVWDTEEAKNISKRRSSLDSNQGKRKNCEDATETPSKKPCTSSSSTKPEETSTTNELQVRSSDNSPLNRNSESNIDCNPSSRNYMPFVLPNIPMLTTLPFAGANNVTRFQASNNQFPGFQYQQSPQYIPVALPQFPVMGMNFMPGFGMMNGGQSQSGSMSNHVPNTLPVHVPVPSQTMPGVLPSSVPNGFFPSMYTNGLHANIMSMRPRDSGYESSEQSSSSKASGSETSHQSFSDDSCQSFTT